VAKTVVCLLTFLDQMFLNALLAPSLGSDALDTTMHPSFQVAFYCVGLAAQSRCSWLLQGVHATCIHMLSSFVVAPNHAWPLLGPSSSKPPTSCHVMSCHVMLCAVLCLQSLEP
jgi:hypothetical protein